MDDEQHTAGALRFDAVDAAKAVYARARDCREHVVFMQIAGVIDASGLMDEKPRKASPESPNPEPRGSP